jgi:hypothetical protein
MSALEASRHSVSDRKSATEAFGRGSEWVRRPAVRSVGGSVSPGPSSGSPVSPRLRPTGGLQLLGRHVCQRSSER